MLCVSYRQRDANLDQKSDVKLAQKSGMLAPNRCERWEYGPKAGSRLEVGPLTGGRWENALKIGGRWEVDPKTSRWEIDPKTGGIWDVNPKTGGRSDMAVKQAEDGWMRSLPPSLPTCSPSPPVTPTMFPLLSCWWWAAAPSCWWTPGRRCCLWRAQWAASERDLSPPASRSVVGTGSVQPSLPKPTPQHRFTPIR